MGLYFFELINISKRALKVSMITEFYHCITVYYIVVARISSIPYEKISMLWQISCEYYNCKYCIFFFTSMGLLMAPGTSVVLNVLSCLASLVVYWIKILWQIRLSKPDHMGKKWLQEGGGEREKHIPTCHLMFVDEHVHSFYACLSFILSMPYKT